MSLSPHNRSLSSVGGALAPYGQRFMLTLSRFQGRVVHNETLTVSMRVSDAERSRSFALAN